LINGDPFFSADHVSAIGFLMISLLFRLTEIKIVRPIDGGQKCCVNKFVKIVKTNGGTLPIPLPSIIPMLKAKHQRMRPMQKFA
jgi:hypothetical protein